MPLIQSSSEKALEENIKRLIAEGKSQTQAVAIALATQRKNKQKKHELEQS